MSYQKLRTTVVSSLIASCVDPYSEARRIRLYFLEYMHYLDITDLFDIFETAQLAMADILRMRKEDAENFKIQDLSTRETRRWELLTKMPLLAVPL